jgi:hypothetical protein
MGEKIGDLARILEGRPVTDSPFGSGRPLQHYKLICLNHLIDVASEEPPEIQVIGDEPRVRISVK